LYSDKKGIILEVEKPEIRFIGRYCLVGIYSDWKTEIEQTITKLNDEMTTLESEKGILEERLRFLGDNHVLKSLFEKDLENGQKRFTELNTLVEDKKAETNKYSLLKSLVEVRAATEE